MMLSNGRFGVAGAIGVGQYYDHKLASLSTNVRRVGDMGLSVENDFSSGSVSLVDQVTGGFLLFYRF